jgi:hypothetical protein
MARLVLRAGPGPFPAVSGRARARPNSAGLMLAHLTWAKFSGLLATELPLAGLHNTWEWKPPLVPEFGTGLD